MAKLKRRTSMAQKTALCALLIMIVTIGYTMLLFALGKPMSAYSAVVPLAAIAVYSVLLDRKLLKALSVCLVTFIVWAVFCAKIFDWSYDGMYYHKQAAITLAEGWNPLRESCVDAQPLNANADLALWLDNYPKGLWICSAAVYIATGLLETSKAVNILFIIALFCVAYSTFTSVYEAPRIRAGIFAAAACLNPVFIGQIFTSYNDLAVGALIITAALLGMKIYSGKADSCDYASLWCAAAMSCLVKFTAPLLVGLILIAYGAAYAVKLIRSNLAARNLPAYFKKPAAVILSGFIIGTVFLGFDPYIKHILNKQNLVYPVLGENKYDIMNTNPPAGFEGKPESVKFFISLASRTSNDMDAGYQLKIPFTVHAEEMPYLSNADTRLGGFGVWFSGISLLALILAGITALAAHRRMRAETAVLLIAFFALGLFFPEAWWARYASYTFYLPLFLILYASEQPGIKPAAYAAVLMLAVNSAINTVCVIKDGREITADINSVLEEIKAQNKRVEIRINDFPSHLKLFEEAGIPYSVAPDSIPDEVVFLEDTKYHFPDE